MRARHKLSIGTNLGEIQARHVAAEQLHCLRNHGLSVDLGLQLTQARDEEGQPILKLLGEAVLAASPGRLCALLHVIHDASLAPRSRRAKYFDRLLLDSLAAAWLLARRGAAVRSTTPAQDSD